MNARIATVQNLIALLFFSIALFITVGILFWVYPRNVIDLELFVEDKTYTTGETITSYNRFISYQDALSTYDSRIVCRNGVERRAFLQQLKATTTKRPTSESTAQYTVPDNIEGHNCVIQITASNCVEILPLLNKCIIEVSESSSFKITEE